MAGYDLPVRAIRQQVSSALDLIVHLDRLEDGSRRVSLITEVQRMESDVITLQDLFTFKLESIAADRTITGELRADGAAADVHRQVREARHRPALEPLRDGPAAALRDRARRTVTMRRLRAAAALVAAVLLAALLATSSTAATTASSVQLVESPLSNFPDMVYSLGLPSDQKLSADQVHVTENGRP